MLFLTCSIIPNVDLARYVISRVQDFGIEGLCCKLICLANAHFDWQVATGQFQS